MIINFRKEVNNFRVDVVEHANNAIKKAARMLPSYLQDRFFKEAYVAGGAVYSINKSGQYKDIDIFLESFSTKFAVADYFKNHVKIHEYYKRPYGKVYEGYIDGSRIFITDNAVSIDDIQIIIKDYGMPEDVLSSFDYKHNMFFVQNSKVYGIVEEWHLHSNYLFFNNERPRDIVGTIIRIPKFLERGMKIEKKEVARALLSLSKVGFSEEEVEELEFIVEGFSVGDSFGS